MTEQCSSIHRIEALEKREEVIFSALKKMEDKFDSKLDLILFQINKIAVLEANHNNHQQSIQRAFAKIETAEDQVRALEMFRSKTEGMAKIAWLLWSTIGVGVVLILIKVFFFGGN